MNNEYPDHNLTNFTSQNLKIPNTTKTELALTYPAKPQIILHKYFIDISQFVTKFQPL